MKYIFLHMHIHLFYLVSEKDYPSSLNCLYIFFKKLVAHIHVSLLGLFLDFCPVDLYFVNTRLS